MYARTFFEEYNIDALTVAPYMGEDSVTPFLSYPDKWVILLALTSNKGSRDFQLTEDAGGERLFEKVLCKSQMWGDNEHIMYVVGATQGQMFEDIRRLAPRLWTTYQQQSRHHLCQSRYRLCRSCCTESTRASTTDGNRINEYQIIPSFSLCYN